MIVRQPSCSTLFRVVIGNYVTILTVTIASSSRNRTRYKSTVEGIPPTTLVQVNLEITINDFRRKTLKKKAFK